MNNNEIFKGEIIKKETTTATNCQVTLSKVKRIIHFSDGVLEECSSDEEGVYQVTSNTALTDPKTLTWVPWIQYNASKALAACDYVGESVANFLGITGPKYRYEIEEAHRMKQEEETEKKETDIEMGGWRERNPSGIEGSITVTNPPYCDNSEKAQTVSSLHY